MKFLFVKDAKEIGTRGKYITYSELFTIEKKSVKLVRRIN